MKRLGASFYRGEAWVRWSMTIEGRQTGWLDDLHHSRLREAMLHTLCRYRISCPVYCLMPDHGHFLWGGLSDESDQLNASKFFRQEWNRLLGGVRGEYPKDVSTSFGREFRLQHQAYDHVLRENESGYRSEVFEKIAGYVLENPVRARLADRFQEWPFLGAIVPGYPRLDPRDEEFWDRYWKFDSATREAGR